MRPPSPPTPRPYVRHVRWPGDPYRLGVLFLANSAVNNTPSGLRPGPAGGGPGERWTSCSAFSASRGDRPAASPPEPLASQLAAWAQPHAPGMDPAVALRAVLIWSRLHGIVSLEIAGNFASMGIDPGQLFEAELAALTA